MENLIIIILVAVILIMAGGYVYREKKNGRKCIGCPHRNACDNSKSTCTCCKDK